MEISAENAYWILEGFATRKQRLHFAGRIDGEEASCDASVISVDRGAHTAEVELFAEDGAESWVRSISLAGAEFRLSMMGDEGFEIWAGTAFHLVLLLNFPDDTTLLFAERLLC
jgi:hypothetical protein